MKQVNPIMLLATWLALGSIHAQPANSAGTTGQNGVIEGRVFNPVSGEYLRNAEVRVQGTGLVAIAENDGRYRIAHVPAGSVTLTVTYTGYQPVSAALMLSAGQVITRDFDLQSEDEKKDGIVSLDRFTVSSTREGTAKAIMEQRNSMNVKNVIASDTFGDMTESNIAEVIQYLPGMEVLYDGGDPFQFSVRGMPAKYSSLTIDGVKATGGSGGSPSLAQYAANAADMIELNKTNSADMDADAPAGSINLKSKSAFQRKGRFFAWQAYSLLNSYQLEFGQRDGPNDGRSHQMHLGANLDYSDVYLEGKLGVVVNLKETTSANEQAILVFTYNTVPTPASPAPVALTTLNYTNGPKVNRRQAGGLNAEYKINDNTILALRSQFNTEHVYIYNRQLQLITTRANQSSASNGTLMVANPTTNNATRAAMVGATTMRRRTNFSIAPALTYAGKKWNLDAALAYTRAGEYINNGRPGQDISMRTTNLQLFGIGWTASRPAPDRTDWTFQQTAGPDLYQLKNWVGTSLTNNLVRAANEPLTKQYLGQANARLTTDWALPTFLKGGIKTLATTYFNTAGSRSWTYIGPTGNRLQAEIPVSPYEFFDGFGGNIFSQKRLQMTDQVKLGTLLYEHPEYFIPNPADRTSAANLFPDRSAKEYIDSAYVMANTRIDRLTLQAGVRYEATKTEAVVYERGVAIERKGKYNDSFLSASGRYRLTDSLMAIASYGQSLSRPTLPSKSAIATINEAQMTGTFPNPNLKPEHGNNYSVRLEYYFEPVGVLSGGLFLMDTKDLIFTSAGVPAEDIGLGGEYPGYLFSTQGNADKFEIKGYEFEYSQQLTFLPGVFRGIGVFGNYARVQYSEQIYAYGRAPETASGGISFRYRGLNAALRASWTPDVVISETTFNQARMMLGTSVDFRLTPRISLFLTGRNILNATITTYRIDLPGYLQRDSKFGSNWAIGMKGTY